MALTVKPRGIQNRNNSCNKINGKEKSESFQNLPALHPEWEEAISTMHKR